MTVSLRFSKVLSIFLSLMFVLVFSTSAFAENIRDNVVKVFVTSNRMDYFRPWQSYGISTGSGSGCIIAGNLILTNAHVVDSATFIQVRKETDPRKYTAKVEAIGHDSDLALLSVNDPDFFKDMVPAQMGVLPFLQDSVVVMGFPEGGDKISITGGVVSRIELVPYSRSGKKLLSVQIDAAINPGNSGGPVYQDGKMIGIAMQVMNNSQNIGYIIPIPIINHFLDDYKNHHPDGFPQIGIDVRNTENKSLREFYRIDNFQGGVLITHVEKYSPAENILKEGDAIISVEDVPLAVDGTYEFRKGERLFFTHLVNSKHIGEILKLEIVRAGKVKLVSLKLTEFTKLVPPPEYFEKPSYYIYGGLIFSVLSADLLKAWGPKWWEKAPVPFLNYVVGKGGLNEKGDKEIVVLLDVLPDDINVGYFDSGNEIISKVNGQEFSSFQEFVNLVEKNKSKYCVFQTEQKTPIILNIEKIDTITAEILKRNNIPAQYSTDVESWLTSGH
ncbi:MAG: trypsin-like peptidase domain-containing protein [Candidatus Omnitrophica bacterium]|nr:trypsin-like peptidase domain-containing protein [Candidatus Omnitrophota bacterium]